MNKFIVAIAAVCLPVLSVVAEQEDGSAVNPQNIVTVINASGNITVKQPVSLDSIVMRRISASAETPADNGVPAVSPTTRSGYRVQVFDDNNPRSASSQAKARQRQMESAFPHMRTYISFNSPYWRVKVGDFRTRAEAENAVAEISAAFPSLSGYLRIVRDKINITD